MTTGRINQVTTFSNLRESHCNKLVAARPGVQPSRQMGSPYPATQVRIDTERQGLGQS